MSNKEPPVYKPPRARCPGCGASGSKLRTEKRKETGVPGFTPVSPTFRIKWWICKLCGQEWNLLHASYYRAARSA